MALEEQIIEWSKSRPPWQKEVLNRIAAGAILTDADYDRLVEEILAPDQEQKSSDLTLTGFGKGSTPMEAVRILAISDPTHVNALVADSPLTFEERGLIIIYGDNGSGKSGYARLLKRVARARHKDEILSDVFRETASEKPSALLSVRIGDRKQEINWPTDGTEELQKMRFYDADCGAAYVSTESDFPYRPSALFLIDGLISTCIALRERMDIRLADNERERQKIPEYSPELEETPISQFLKSLSAKSSIAELDQLIAQFNPTEVARLKQEESSLRSNNTDKERGLLLRQAEKLQNLTNHLTRVQKELAPASIEQLQAQRTALTELEKAAELAAHEFDAEPLNGVGTPAWKVLWEAARRFSLEHAYPDLSFPTVAPDARCVLCHQELEPSAKERYDRFERFIQDDIQKRLRESQASIERLHSQLTSVAILPEAIADQIKDLTATYSPLMRNYSNLLTGFSDLKKALASGTDFPETTIHVESVISELSQQAATAGRMAAELADPEITAKKLSETIRKLSELELLGLVKESRERIIAEIKRLEDRARLDEIKTSAATGPITKKMSEWSAENVTEVVRDQFTRETERLGLEKITIAKTRAEHTKLLHQPKLVGARQDASVSGVFSEGEQTALGLAAFFTEAELDDSRSALILDDPVSSLDHIRRKKVAARLACLAETRQVIVFSHDVSFVYDLKKEAEEANVLATERSIVRSRADESRPGICRPKHPWKAKDMPERFSTLRNSLTFIMKNQAEWDQDTYEKEVASWAGHLSETWERIFSQEIVGQMLAEGGLEVRPVMVKILAKFTENDEKEFQSSYGRISQWAKRHDKSVKINYVAPPVKELEDEFGKVEAWHKRIKGYKS